MQQTQKQSAHDIRVCEVRERISTIPAQIDQLIQAYLFARKDYPKAARVHLNALEAAIAWLRCNEEALERLEANPDCTF